MRTRILKTLYRLFPFDLRGDCFVPPASHGIRISCIINFYGRLDLLSGILHSLSLQNFHRNSFEIILVEDRSGTEEGRKMAEEFASSLPIVYAPLDRNFGRMGYSRNFGLSRSRGEYILFLDDDTVILQEDFLSKLVAVFQSNPEIDALVPHGNASFGLVKGRYAFHDPYFMTSRCTAYRRSVLSELGGFVDDFIGQEDVEFVVRFFMAGKKTVNSPQLEYFHPPLLVSNLRKPQAVGSSFCGIRKRYPLVVWLLVILNCSRHAPLYLLPGRRNREMGRFGIGFLVGAVASLFKKSGFRYD
ncbi:MAG: glycosyltransferase family 2 protein [Deltaproteobacteria bacterium]|nr:glycosyltransferase family 2 protein [Deltaproteobacteria bacterium]TLN02265.1 MAG: glycosyltransferase family 2 protein [bacterium]